jgi:hypothetical protein
MSIKLTTLTYNIINLSSTEKHVLKSFAWRANDNGEAWSSIARLEVDTGLTKRTIEPALKKLRDKSILKYTGEFKGKSGLIPVYLVNIDNGNYCRDKDLNTAIYVFDTGNFCIEMTVKIAVHKDNIKNNIKNNGFSSNSSKPKPYDIDFQYQETIRKAIERLAKHSPKPP